MMLPFPPLVWAVEIWVEKRIKYGRVVFRLVAWDLCDI